MSDTLSYDRVLDTLQVKQLNLFLENGKFKIPSGNSCVNIFNQMESGGSYLIPFDEGNLRSEDFCFKSDDKTKNIQNTLLEKHVSDMLENDPDSSKTPIERFFELLEKCRLHGIMLGFAERQYFEVPIKKVKKTIPVNEVFSNEDLADMLGEDEPIPFETQTVEQEIEKVPVNKSCIELDFDIYQNTHEPILEEATYYSIIYQISRIIASHFDFGALEKSGGVVTHTGGASQVKFHMAILRKPEIVEAIHKKHGKCWKDSCHIRIFIKTTKEYKKFLIKTINEQDVLMRVFNASSIVGNVSDVLDRNSPHFPAMFLGSKKNKSKVGHLFYKLYTIEIRNWPIIEPVVSPSKEFDPLPPSATIEKPIKLVDPTDSRRKVLQTPKLRHKYNLCYELSLCYENPCGFIKKRQVPLKKDIESLITTTIERTNNELIPEEEIEEIKSHVTNLVVRDYQAKYIKEILDMLNISRAEEYQSWRDIVIILAKENPDYKPLAVYFSQRCPSSWMKNGFAELDKIWEWALSKESDTSNVLDSERKYRKINTLFEWAKTDNPDKYREAQELNAFTKLQAMAFRNGGKLHETDFAELLKIMCGDILLVDDDTHTRGKGVASRQWYEFVFPDEDMVEGSGSMYKWRLEKYPDTLDKYITKKLPRYVGIIRQWIEEKFTKETDADAQKYYSKLSKALKESCESLGKDRMVRNIINRCMVEFRRRGFSDMLDKDPNVVGVGNGVLKLFPKTELLQRFHEIPITRSTHVNYVYEKIDINDPALSTEHSNPYIKRLFNVLLEIMSHDVQSLVKIMCFMSTSLDGRKKRPLFFIWLGEGSNGKSFLLELHTKTLHEVVLGGYAAKMNVQYFTSPNNKHHGPDSEKSMLKFARSAYCSESSPGDELQMSQIKEFTSETISANEKHETQDMFEANCNYIMASNYDPKISGRDFGTWRRILALLFRKKFVDNPNPDCPEEVQCDWSLVNEVPYDINYKKAYLSILVYFYEMFRDKYGFDLSKIPCAVIDKDTQDYRDSQDTIERFITEQVIYIGDTYEDGELVRKVSVTDLGNKYMEWYRKKIDSAVKVNIRELTKEFPKTRLKKSFETISREVYLTKHRVLNLGEEYTPQAAVAKPMTTPVTSLTEPVPAETTVKVENAMDFDFLDDIDDMADFIE